MHTLRPKHNTHRYVDDNFNVYLIKSWRGSKPHSELMMTQFIDQNR